MPDLAVLKISNYTAAAIALSFSGFLNGYDTGCIGAIIHMKQFSDALGHLSPTVLGITVSMIMLTGILPSLIAGQLADQKGRLRIILPGALLFGLGALLQATAFSLGQFIVGRAISGAGQGFFFGNVAVYITEIAPRSSRGRLAALPQFMATLGICLGYFSCYLTSSVESSTAWRLPYVIQITVSALLAMVCRILPESPRWLLQHGRGPEAIQALQMLNFNMDEARQDFLQTPQEQPSLTNWQSFALLFRGPYRPRTLLALFALSMAQLSGIDAITYYAPALFTQAGISKDNTSLIASGVASITMLAVTIPAFLLADKWGRRTSAITGGVSLSGLMFLIGTLYATGAVDSTAVAKWVVVVSVFMFGMIFCATWGIVTKIYASEIQAGHTRAAGNSIGMAFSFFTNWLVALITPILLSASVYGAYFLFGSLTLLGAAIFVIYMPETRGRSLEDIQGEFRHPALSQFTSVLRLLGLERQVAPSSSPVVEEPIELSGRRQESTGVNVDHTSSRALTLTSGSL